MQDALFITFVILFGAAMSAFVYWRAFASAPPASTAIEFPTPTIKMQREAASHVRRLDLAIAQATDPAQIAGLTAWRDFYANLPDPEDAEEGA